MHTLLCRTTLLGFHPSRQYSYQPHVPLLLLQNQMTKMSHMQCSLSAVIIIVYIINIISELQLSSNPLKASYLSSPPSEPSTLARNPSPPIQNRFSTSGVDQIERQYPCLQLEYERANSRLSGEYS